MVDRVTEYFGALVRETDGLQSQQNQMVGLGYALQASLGTAVAVDGFTCIPNTPAALNVIVTAGSVMATQSLEATTWSSLPVNTATTIIKQGLLNVNDVIGITPPGTTGYSQAFLIEVQYADLDTSPVLLPYYNAANPTVPFNGPAGSGTSQNTARLGIASIQVKAGTAAPTGTQAIPTPDAGWTGLFVVTVANGASTITSGNITTYATAPFIPVKLPGVPAAVQAGQWIYGAAGGSSTAYTVSLVPTLLTLTVGSEILVYFGTANTSTSPTLNVNGLGAKPIVKQGGGAPQVASVGVNADVSGWMSLVYDGTNWRINGLVASDVRPVGSSASSPYSQTTHGSYTFTAVITGWHRITCWGAGGGGGASTSTTSAGGGGGGGGRGVFYQYLSAAQTLALVVGTGGTAGNSGANGGNGGATTVAGTSIASGGTGGFTTSGTGAGTGGSPGTGLLTGAGYNTPGQTGGQGSNVTPIIGGAGGASPAAGYGSYQSTNGNPGLGTGSGASGAVNQSGGAGSDGAILIEW